jgi:alpha/beta superfamily hydrolase
VKTKVVLNVDNIDISGQLYLPSNQIHCSTVCICHGIPAHSPEPGESGYASLAEIICDEGFAVLIFNFRGTGMSSGNLDILGWTRDLKAIIDYLCSLPEVDKSHLSLLGFSAGAAISIYVASKDNRISSIVPCSCPAEFDFVNEVNEPQSVVDHFRSIGTIRDKNFPQSAIEWLNGFKLVCPIRCISKIAPRPLLIIHGDQDETVDVSHAHRLYKNALGPKNIVIFENAGHRLRQDDRAITTVIDWLKSKCQDS